MSRELRQALDEVARRFRLTRLWGSLAVCWLAWAAAAAGVCLLLNRSGSGWTPGTSLLVLSAVLVVSTGVACAVLSLRSARDRRWVARRIEARHPELGTGLLAAVEEDASSTGRLGFLQSAVIARALEHRRLNDWNETVPTRAVRATQAAHVLALGLAVAAFATLAVRVRSRENARALLALGSAASDVKVEPGDAAIERGTSLLVVARFHGGVPADVNLVVDDGSPVSASRAMSRSLEDPAFAGRVESVAADLTYRVEFQGRRSPTYHVTVFEYPELQRTDANLKFPTYTALPPKTVEDVRHVTAVEGTELTLTCRLNKEVSVAQLIDAEGRTIKLTPQAGGGHAYRATLTLSDPRRYRLGLVDRTGRTNKLPAEIAVNVTRNRPAVVTMSQPARDVRVSPVEELTLRAQLEDDFGLVRRGVSYTLAGQEPREVVLKGPASASATASRREKVEHMIDFEALRAAPDHFVTYFVWAEDVGPDGKTRRSSGDMFFAEVRDFEEIFRQGEQPPGDASESEGEAGENAQAAMQLAELQKEIINGTWALIRRETGSKPSAKFADDGKTLQESQKTAIDQADQLAGRLQNAASKTHLAQATGFMKDAGQHLAEAVGRSRVPTLSTAIGAEQAAYQALLKLRDREFNVVRGNPRQRQGGRASAGSPSQRQLQQLELSNEENRYEEQRSARAQQSKLSQREKEQGETRQVINRLRELARRQTDLNDRVKELQSALQAARTAQAREEIERQLKRLRDQQQQILRDTDELRERLENEENRDRMAEAREQVEESREHVRQASEALDEGRLARAVTEGTRAGRQMNDLREQLRKGASDRFSEEMTEMRGEARRLDEGQTKLSEQLDEWNRQPRRTLRDDAARQQVRKDLGRQQKQLDGLLDRMRQTVQDAEETQPLLAKGLFDTVREANEKSIPEALKQAGQLVDAGVPEEAAKASRHAGQGIGRLREGVERAAKSVLGDETAALQRAQGELDELADQINREIAQATGRPTDRPGNDPSRPASRQARAGEGAPDQPLQDGAASPREGQDPAAQPGQGDRNARKGQQGGRDTPKDQPKGKGQRGQPGRQGQGQGQGGEGGEPQKGQAQPEGNRPGGGRPGQQAGSPRGGPGGNAALDRLLEGVPNGPGGPITGEGFRQWSDRLRDVEELLENPEMRAEAARIRDRARGAREEFKRHSRVPDWTKLKSIVADPIRELRDRVAEEVRRRASPDALVPIDRDPVPPQYAEGVRRYYERLGSGR